jgi:purine-binding chemotaxis protein CheW
MLLCRAGSLLCAIPARDVVETMRPLAVEAVAGMPDYVAGLSIVRGEPTPVVDAQRVFDRGAAAQPAGRWVLLSLGERRAALAVTAIVGVETVRRSDLAPLPPVLDPDAASVLDAIGARDANLLVVLKELRTLPEAAWAAIDTRRAAS